MLPKISVDELRLLLPIVLEVMRTDKDDTFKEILEYNILKIHDDYQPLVLPDDVDPKLNTSPRLILTVEDALIDFMTYIVMDTKNEIYKMIDEFFAIPLNDMLLYIVERPHIGSILRCPPAIKGPQTWQVILARWRLRIER